jgi:hypothetical protein
LDVCPMNQPRSSRLFQIRNSQSVVFGRLAAWCKKKASLGVVEGDQGDARPKNLPWAQVETEFVQAAPGPSESETFRQKGFTVFLWIWLSGGTFE